MVIIDITIPAVAMPFPPFFLPTIPRISPTIPIGPPRIGIHQNTRPIIHIEVVAHNYSPTFLLFK